MRYLALIGNQNCGKTTLFNRLTGSNQHVGNFPGVTVEKKEGTLLNHKSYTVVDLPGIYSLSPYTAEEIVTRDFALKEHPSAIINIVDATNLERNLYLSLQLMELNIPVVIALNMMDEVRHNGNSIDIARLSQQLGVPVVPISAGKNEGINDLVEAVIKAAEKNEPPKRFDFCEGAVHRALHAIAHLIEDHAEVAGYPPRFAATKLIEGDDLVHASLNLCARDAHVVEHLICEMEESLGTDREAALADMRYSFIERVCQSCSTKTGETKEQKRSKKIDRILTHKILAIPIFLGVMLLIFYLSFSVIGAPLQTLLEYLIELATARIDAMLTSFGVSQWVHSFLIDGALAGIGSVLSFLPIIVLLFFFLSILEDGGYMARVAFVMDTLLRKIGLSGRSMVSLLIGFGCSVPAIMSTRTLASERDRKMTIGLTPFMSCSAKLPIYGMMTAAFFPNQAALVLLTMYALGIITTILSGLLLKSTLFRGTPTPFVMELPAYRFPAAKSVLIHMWEKAKDFIKKAFTIIFVASIVIWFLQNFDTRLNLVSDVSDSMLAAIGSFLSPIFAPLGFTDWRASTALITGLSAKETVVSTLTILTGSTTDAQLTGALTSIFTPASAAAFLTFTILYMPCVAAFAAMRREMESSRWAVVTVAGQTALAWVCAG
ncbi:MAG: ferrous iron transport protein B, partial [Clostridia bacterium]|nr:ferrous iron transport protein B [Clostridia bacterium]